ncbi:MAG: MmgE/PrpD family protein [Proteobacteria bacterium]|nr:MmgE/PrpD family protein [Pseudomonadota bacterium]
MDTVTEIVPAGMAETGAGLTRHLAARAAATTLDALTPDARAVVRHCVLDYLGCALAGASEPLALMLLDEMQEQGGAAQASVIGHRARLPAASAALVNGAASHALDYDDVNMAMPGHPTVAILPALLALAEARGAGGAAVAAAFAAGYELQCRVGRLVAPGHYDGLGFHATATIGSFGAAAACAHLLGLDAERTATALGIAATQAAGLKSMFGTMCKPLHAGKASYHGLLAARLAARGFTSRTDALECAQGFARTHGPDFKPAAALADPGPDGYLRANLFKYHAACYLTHAPIEAARSLRLAHGVTPERVARIVLRIDDAADRICNIAAPRTGLESKFSLRQTIAMALAGVETGALASYSEELAADPVLAALREKVSIDFQTGWPHPKAALDLHLTDGTVLTAAHDAGVPAADLDEQGMRLEAKFAALAVPAIGEARAADAAALVRRFDSLGEVGTLLGLCAPPPG